MLTLHQELCAFSLGFNTNGEVIQPENIKPEHKRRFLSVASRVSSSHLTYNRDLIMLLDFSMVIHDKELALDLSKFVTVCSCAL